MWFSVTIKHISRPFDFWGCPHVVFRQMFRYALHLAYLSWAPHSIRFELFYNVFRTRKFRTSRQLKKKLNFVRTFVTKNRPVREKSDRLNEHRSIWNNYDFYAWNKLLMTNKQVLTKGPLKMYAIQINLDSGIFLKANHKTLWLNIYGFDGAVSTK